MASMELLMKKKEEILQVRKNHHSVKIPILARKLTSSAYAHSPVINEDAPKAVWQPKSHPKARPALAMSFSYRPVDMPLNSVPVYRQRPQTTKVFDASISTPTRRTATVVMTPKKGGEKRVSDASSTKSPVSKANSSLHKELFSSFNDRRNDRVAKQQEAMRVINPYEDVEKSIEMYAEKSARVLGMDPSNIEQAVAVSPHQSRPSTADTSRMVPVAHIKMAVEESGLPINHAPDSSPYMKVAEQAIRVKIPEKLDERYARTKNERTAYMDNKTVGPGPQYLPDKSQTQKTVNALSMTKASRPISDDWYQIPKSALNHIKDKKKKAYFDQLAQPKRVFQETQLKKSPPMSAKVTRQRQKEYEEAREMATSPGSPCPNPKALEKHLKRKSSFGHLNDPPSVVEVHDDVAERKERHIENMTKSNINSETFRSREVTRKQSGVRRASVEDLTEELAPAVIADILNTTSPSSIDPPPQHSIVRIRPGSATVPIITGSVRDVDDTDMQMMGMLTDFKADQSFHGSALASEESSYLGSIGDDMDGGGGPATSTRSVTWSQHPTSQGASPTRAHTAKIRRKPPSSAGSRKSSVGKRPSTADTTLESRSGVSTAGTELSADAQAIKNTSRNEMVPSLDVRRDASAIVVANYPKIKPKLSQSEAAALSNDRPLRAQSASARLRKVHSEFWGGLYRGEKRQQSPAVSSTVSIVQGKIEIKPLTERRLSLYTRDRSPGANFYNPRHSVRLPSSKGVTLRVSGRDRASAKRSTGQGKGPGYHPSQRYVRPRSQTAIVTSPQPHGQTYRGWPSVYGSMEYTEENKLRPRTAPPSRRARSLSPKQVGRYVAVKRKPKPLSTPVSDPATEPPLVGESLFFSSTIGSVLESREKKEDLERRKQLYEAAFTPSWEYGKNETPGPNVYEGRVPAFNPKKSFKIAKPSQVGSKGLRNGIGRSANLSSADYFPTVRFLSKHQRGSAAPFSTGPATELDPGSTDVCMNESVVTKVIKREAKLRPKGSKRAKSADFVRLLMPAGKVDPDPNVIVRPNDEKLRQNMRQPAVRHESGVHSGFGTTQPDARTFVGEMQPTTALRPRE